MTPEPRGWHRVVVSTWYLTKEKNANLVSLGETSYEKKANCFMNDFKCISRISLKCTLESFDYTLLSFMGK